MIDMKLTGERIASVCKDRGITVRKIQKELSREKSSLSAALFSYKLNDKSIPFRYAFLKII